MPILFLNRLRIQLINGLSIFPSLCSRAAPASAGCSQCKSPMLFLGFLTSSWAFLRCLRKFHARIKEKQILCFGLKRFCACPAKCWADCLGPLKNMWHEAGTAKSNLQGHIQRDGASSPWKRRHLSLTNEEKRKSCFSVGLVMSWSIWAGHASLHPDYTFSRAFDTSFLLWGKQEGSLLSFRVWPAKEEEKEVLLTFYWEH